MPGVPLWGGKRDERGRVARHVVYLSQKKPPGQLLLGGRADDFPCYCFGWKAIERAEMVKASEKHMPSSAP